MRKKLNENLKFDLVGLYIVGFYGFNWFMNIFFV